MAFDVVCHGEQPGDCTSYEAFNSTSVQKEICEKHFRRACLEKQQSAWKSSRDDVWQHIVGLEAIELLFPTSEGSQTNKELSPHNMEALLPEYLRCELQREDDYALYCKSAKEETEWLQMLQGMLLGIPSALFVLQSFVICTAESDRPCRWLMCSLVFGFFYFCLTCYAICIIAMEPEPHAGIWVLEAIQLGVFWLFAVGGMSFAWTSDPDH